MEDRVIFDGLLWVAVERATVKILSPDNKEQIDQLVRLELLEPAIERGPGHSIWVGLHQVIGLTSNLNWQNSEWCQGVFNGMRQGH